MDDNDLKFYVVRRTDGTDRNLNIGKTRRHRHSDDPSLWTAKRVSGRHTVTDLEVHDGVFDF